MRYIKLYENFELQKWEDIMVELEDIAVEFKDIGFDIAVYKSKDSITIGMSRISAGNVWNLPNNIDIEHLECILRMFDYAKSEGFKSYNIRIQGKYYENLIPVEIIDDYSASVGKPLSTNSINSNFKLYTVHESKPVDWFIYKMEITFN